VIQRLVSLLVAIWIVFTAVMLAGLAAQLIGELIVDGKGSKSPRPCRKDIS
jgi:hypothetical protein